MNNLASWTSIITAIQKRGTEEKGLKSANPTRTDETVEVEPQ